MGERDQPRLMTGLSNRLHEEDVSVRTRMLELAAGLEDVIHLGRGDPDFDTPDHVVEAGLQALKDRQHHYTHPAGMPALRQAIAEELREKNQLDYQPEEVIVTAGVQEAIMLTILTLVEDRDEVLLSLPRYTTYDHAIYLAGGVPVSVPTLEEDDFALMPEQIEANLSDNTKLLVLVTPNNPTGAVTPPEVIREIAQLVLQKDILVISDEIYGKLVYGHLEHLSIGSLPGLWERTITVNGFSKTYAMTGWRVGYLAAPLPAARMLLEVRHAMSICTSTPSQFAALAALTGPQTVVEEMRAAYDQRRRFVMEALDQMGLTYGYPGGGYYIYANVSSTGLSAEAFCEQLLREARVLMFPGSLFGDPTDRYVRISLVQPLGTIRVAIERIQEQFSKIRADD